MYKLIDLSGQLIGIVKDPYYIRLQENGFYGRCSEKDAQGITYNNVVYHISNRPEMNQTEPDIVLVVKDDGDVLYDLMSQLSDFIVDQEYRTSVLEIITASSSEKVLASKEE